VRENRLSLAKSACFFYFSLPCVQPETEKHLLHHSAKPAEAKNLRIIVRENSNELTGRLEQSLGKKREDPDSHVSKSCLTDAAVKL
jgi:hypothetical protein